MRLAPIVISLSSGAELARVREEVGHHLRKALRIAGDHRQVVRELDVQRLPALRQESGHQVLGILHDLGERDLLAADAELAGLDAHALEQVVDEAREPERPALQRFEQLAEPLARHRLEAVQHQLDGGELRRKRRAELVGDVREHGIARAAHGLELGFVAHHLHLQPADGRRARDDDGARHAARLEVFGGLRLAVVARSVDRAIRVAGTRPFTSRGFSTSPQNFPISSSAGAPSIRAACGLR